MDNELTKDSEGQIDLRDILARLWQHKLFIIFISFAGWSTSYWYTQSLPDLYESKVLMMPSDALTANDARAQLPAMGGFFGLGAVSGGSGVTNSTLAMERLKSLSFFKRHLYDEILPELVAVRTWDHNKRAVVYDKTLYDRSTKEWAIDPTTRKSVRPSPQASHGSFRNSIEIASSGSGLLTLRVIHQSPLVAREWAQLIIEKINEDIRLRDIKQAEAALDFLQGLLSENSIVTLDQIFAQLIEEETKKILLASVTNEYVFEVIDPPVVSEVSFGPDRKKTCAVVTLIFLILSIVLVLVKDYLLSSYQFSRLSFVRD